jgi:phage anti-repressor protein
MSSSIRIKVQLGEEIKDNYNRYSTPLLKFIYVIESPSNKTINELIRTLQKYINQQFLNNNTELVQLTTADGFILSKSDKCSDVLKDNDHILCIDMRTFANEIYSTINFDKLWFEIKQHDASDNQEKLIQIGLNNFSKLFIRFYANSNAYGIYVFSIFELISIASEKRNGIDSSDNLITRFDNQTSTNDWFLEAKWEYDTVSNKDLFIICNLKVASNDEVYSNKLHIHLDHSRLQIEKGEVTRLSGEINDGKTLTDQQRQRLKELTSKLPLPKRTGPQINLPTDDNFKLTKHECEGESSIRMACGNTNTINTYQDQKAAGDGTFYQYFFITHIIFSKKPLVLPEISQQKRSAPADKPISVANLTVFYQTHDGAWRECQNVAIAPITLRNEEPKWLTDFIINIEPDKLISFIIKGSILTKGEPGLDHQARNRIHKSLPQPLKLKIVVTDNFDRQSSLIVEQLNKPLELTTRESFLKTNQSSINELLALVYVDDFESDGRIYMAIYLNKDNALVIKNPGSYSVTYQRTNLRKMEYNAKQNKTTEVHLKQIYYKNNAEEAKGIALYDPESYMLYAIRFELTSKTSKTEETVAIPIEKIQ